jgi:hypothetical protein
MKSLDNDVAARAGLRGKGLAILKVGLLVRG